ncbi:MAG: IPT/TIG domain-containing protein [Prevotellaceae bacterium]|jgi:hypothetical protein|nr:IPT/TIG domain-containing protein [Prevotellaceae bacterium]
MANISISTLPKCYTIAVLLAIGLEGCKEKVHIEHPITPDPPIIADFSPKRGAIKTEITITGKNLATVDSVYIADKNGGRINMLKSRISDGMIIAEVMAGVSTGPITVRSPRGSFTTPDNATNRFTVSYTTPKLDTGVRDVTINEVAVFKGVELTGITKVEIGEELAPFSFQHKDSMGVIVPNIPGTTATMTYFYATQGNSNHSEYYKNNTGNITLNVHAPVVAIANISESPIIPGRRFTIAGRNLNVIDAMDATPEEGGAVSDLMLFKGESDSYTITAKFPQATSAGSYTVRFKSKGVEKAATTITLQPLPSPTLYTLMNFEDIVENNAAYTRSLSSTNGNHQYYIYDKYSPTRSSGFTNRVVTSANGGLLTAQEGSKFANLQIDYNRDSAFAAGVISNACQAPAAPGAITFAHMPFINANNVAALRKIKEPVVHFLINTAGSRISGTLSGTATPPPSIDFYFVLTTGYRFSNGQTAAIFTIPENGEVMRNNNSPGEWKMFALRLTDGLYLRHGATSTNATSCLQTDINPIDPAEGRKAILDGRVGEIRLRVKTISSATAGDQHIEVNTDNFVVADQVLPGAIDITPQ